MIDRISGAILQYNVQPTHNILIIISIFICTILVLISYWIWTKYGKDKQITPREITDYHIKKDPLEIALIYQEKVTDKDFYITLIYLAEQGLIKIKEKNSKFSIIKGKEYTGKNKNIKDMLDILFKKNKNEYLKTIEGDTIKEKTAKIIKKISPTINDGKLQEKYYNQESEQKKSILIIMMSFILILVTCLPFLETNKLIFVPISLILSIITLTILVKFVDKINLAEIRIKNILLIIFAFITVWLLLLLPIFTINKLYIITYLYGVASVSIILYLYKFMSKKTAKALEELNSLEEIKKYTTKNNVDIENNPKYLYSIFPYSYILGINDIIIKKMKQYNCKKPAWWVLEDKFTVVKFENSVNRFLEFLNQ